ncbi:STAS domain-containing protein [Streptomyces sp. NBC_00887]|uniref:STAS domain-containing protein n=1 Tax=Streptomyces sp. NBC_00887 TaxID=2975859 RepID=UPI0038703973|nr:STAS domain-containing protein [Streptomyces sp. NBC_00887]
MTAQPSRPFTLIVEAGTGTARLHLVGDLDYDTSGELTRQADACLTEFPDLRELHLDCAGLRLCDSMGVSALLMVHRRTSARNVALHLHNPPPFLERVLDLTGIRKLFVQAPPSQQDEQTHTNEAAPTSRPPTSPSHRPTV